MGTKTRLPARLAERFRRNGNIREPNPLRLGEGHRRYKKGREVRIVVESASDLAEVRRELASAGLRPGRPYRKGAAWVQPVYGRAAAELFKQLRR